MRSSRAAIGAAFLVQGLLFISLTTRMPVIADLFDLGELALSGLMLMMVLLAGVGSVAAESWARRLGSAHALRAALVLLATGFAVMGWSVRETGTFGLFVVGLALYGLALGAVDATTNMQAVALEHRLARPVLPSFHAWWTLGGILATLFTLGLGDRLGSGPWGAWLLAVPVVAAASGPLLAQEPPDAAANDTSTESLGIPWRAIVFVGLALIVFYMVDTATTAWGPLYLSSDTVFAEPAHDASLFALASLPYLIATLAARLVGDRSTARFGARSMVRAGAVVAFVGLVAVVFAPTWPVAVIGFFVVGLGMAVVAPLSFSAAARLAGDESNPLLRRRRVDAAIARFNQFNYVGALLGAVLTGAIGAGNLRIGYAVPMVLVLALVPLARHFSGAPGAPEDTVAHEVPVAPENSLATGEAAT
ncbi:major facilitator transporter [Knoellia subterranea KCTC 19937]|uniref:Major facilitator transporter n=1 Tax=Knoellia subterranea KCTC 19937 TaxID=1385521 RepID=A0A0A0JV41_9MICO|nr:major facilitator transporter [Knoellia subterranea KCTC 19937]